MEIHEQLKNIFRKIKHISNSSIVSNFSYLTISKVFAILVPLVTLPYILNVLGKEIYGLVVFAQAVVSYFVIFVNFGFNTLAIQEISVNRDDKTKISRIVSNVLILKGGAFFICFGLLYLGLSFIPQAKGYENLFLLSMWVCLYEFLFPIWYFQGIEKMKYITYLNVISRSVFLILIFLLIKSPEHYLRLPIINGIGVIVSGISALIIVFWRHKIIVTLPKSSELIKFTKKSLDYFISNISVKIYASSNKVIIGSVLSMAEVAYYDLAEKIISVFRTVPLSIVRDSIFPKVAKTKNIKIVWYTTLIMGAYSIIVIIFIILFGDKIVLILGGKDMLTTVDVLKIFSIYIFTTHISNYYITVALWSWGYKKIFRNIMVFSSILFLFIYVALWLGNLINLYTIVIVPILVDVYTIIHIYFVVKQKKDLQFNL